MSTQKGNDKKKGQKFQNKKAFKIQFNEKAEEILKKAPLDRLCKRCHEQIEWKIRFQKYKPATTVSRCAKCNEKRIYKAYRNCCDVCSDKFEICTKCLESKELQAEEKEQEGVDKKLLEKMEAYMKTLRERSRRKLLRLINKNQITWGEEYFVYSESGKPVENIKFKQEEKDEDFEDVDEDDEDDEDDEGGEGEDDFEDDEGSEEEEKNEKKKSQDTKKPQKKGNTEAQQQPKVANNTKNVKKKQVDSDDDDEEDDLDDEDGDDSSEEKKKPSGK